MSTPNQKPGSQQNKKGLGAARKPIPAHGKNVPAAAVKGINTRSLGNVAKNHGPQDSKAEVRPQRVVPEMPAQSDDGVDEAPRGPRSGGNSPTFAGSQSPKATSRGSKSGPNSPRKKFAKGGHSNREERNAQLVGRSIIGTLQDEAGQRDAQLEMAAHYDEDGNEIPEIMIEKKIDPVKELEVEVRRANRERQQEFDEEDMELSALQMGQSRFSIIGKVREWSPILVQHNSLWRDSLLTTGPIIASLQTVSLVFKAVKFVTQVLPTFRQNFASLFLAKLPFAKRAWNALLLKVVKFCDLILKKVVRIEAHRTLQLPMTEQSGGGITLDTMTVFANANAKNRPLNNINGPALRPHIESKYSSTSYFKFWSWTTFQYEEFCINPLDNNVENGRSVLSGDVDIGLLCEASCRRTMAVNQTHSDQWSWASRLSNAVSGVVTPYDRVLVNSAQMSVPYVSNCIWRSYRDAMTNNGQLNLEGKPVLNLSRSVTQSEKLSVVTSALLRMSLASLGCVITYKFGVRLLSFSEWVTRKWSYLNRIRHAPSRSQLELSSVAGKERQMRRLRPSGLKGVGSQNRTQISLSANALDRLVYSSTVGFMIIVRDFCHLISYHLRSGCGTDRIATRVSVNSRNLSRMLLGWVWWPISKILNVSLSILSKIIFRL